MRVIRIVLVDKTNNTGFTPNEMDSSADFYS